MTEAMDALKQKNTSIWVFAEGTRNKGNGLLPFKKGAFHMAKQAGVPLLPIVASTYPAQLDFSKWCSAHVIIRILPPVTIHEEDTVNHLRQQVRTQMIDAIEDLDQRLADQPLRQAV